MKQSNTFTDGNILIRPFSAEDINPLYEAVRQSISEISQWLDWCHANYSLEEASAFVLSRDEAWKTEDEYGFAVLDVETRMFLGCVGLNQFNRNYQFCNLGYWIRTSHTGRGIASSAARLAARFALAELNLHRVEILAATGNHASQRTAEKIGAVREGELRKRLLIKGQPADAVLYSLIKEDF
jgi:RimJ/RimL family protein N-acetyltransferase